METNKNKINGITTVIPAYSELSTVNNSMLSLCQQWIPDDTFQLEVILVNDNPQKGCQFDFYLSEHFKTLIKPNISIRLITHLQNKGQGVARNTGIQNAKYDFVVLCDEDDIYAPNALYRFWEILEKEHCGGEDKKPISMLCAPIYSFDKDFYRNIIDSNSIWVNAKVYNREFLQKYNIEFPSDVNSHRAEDYPFSRMVDYASRHDNDFKRIDMENDVDTFYYWFPNPKSRSRCDEHYDSLLAGYTMKASNMIFDFIKDFNNKHLTEDEYWAEDESLKHEILNMTIYSFYNLLWFLRDLATGWTDCKKEYWDILRESVSNLRDKLLVFWAEIVPSDIADMLYQVKHHSDCRFIESWIGSFENFVNKRCELLDKNFDEIQAYCKTLKFDDANHEINAPYVTAWLKRHKRNEINNVKP